MVGVNLTFDQLTSKSIGIIYVDSKTKVCAKFDNSVSSYHPDKVWSLYQHVDDLSDLKL